MISDFNALTQTFFSAFKYYEIISSLLRNLSDQAENLMKRLLASLTQQSIPIEGKLQLLPKKRTKIQKNVHKNRTDGLMEG